MAENDLFQIIEQLEPGDLIYDRHFGIKGSRSGDFVIIDIESDARRRGEKEAFLARLSDKLLPRRELPVTMSSSVSP